MKSKNYLNILYYLSIFIIMIGIIQLLPLIILPFYPQEASEAKCFIIPGVLSILCGYLISFFLKGYKVTKLGKHYDSILVVAIWIVAILISSVPWMLTGNYNFTQAVFEMTSGYSTTGLSVIDVNQTSHLFLFFRSIVLFVGGVGLVLILTCAMSERYGLSLYNIEGHNDRLLPNLAKSARLILSIYSFYIVAGIAAYKLAGMDWFDAVNTSIAALSTGGFSVNALSIYGYHSLAVEIITIVLMLLGMTNFMIHYCLIKRRFKDIWKNTETKFFLATAVIFISIMVISLLNSGYSNNFFTALRVSVFNFMTTITTTGFVSVEDLSALPFAVFNLMTVAMLIGGNAESTSGGIKQLRVITALKGVIESIKGTIKRDNVINSPHIYRAGKRYELSDENISSTSSYIILYLLLFGLGSYIFTCYGYSLHDSMFEFSSAISTVGLSVGITNYSANGIILWTAIIGMLFGRLEIMVIFQAILKGVTDITKKEY